MIQKFEEFITESVETNQFKKALLKYGASNEIFWDGNEMFIFPKKYEEVNGEVFPRVFIISEGDGFNFYTTDKKAPESYGIECYHEKFEHNVNIVWQPWHTLEKTENGHFAFTDSNAKQIMDAIDNAEKLNAKSR